MGGEYFFSTHFSLGGELQLNRLSIGDLEREPPLDFPSPRQESSNVVANSGLVFVRWYF